MTTKYVTDLNQILKAVSEEFGIPVDLITSPDMRTKPVAQARHVAMYLACNMTWFSKRKIAESFKTADHSALYYGLNKVSVILTKDTEISRRVRSLAKRLEPK